MLLAEEKPSANSIGYFGYLEGHEYRMVNTYDVHFYSSIALAMLFPEDRAGPAAGFRRNVDIAIPKSGARCWIMPFARARSAGRCRTTWAGRRKIPLFLVNGYDFHDSGIWKDLNPKFVLQVYRDFTFYPRQRLSEGMLGVGGTGHGIHDPFRSRRRRIGGK